MRVDLRSDTVTRPTPQMRRAMASAEVGDDQYGEDPTVNALQEAFAARVGKDAAIYVPSGTMANQLVLRVLTRPGDGVIAGAHQHIVAYEHGAGPANSGVTFVNVDDAGGALDAEEVSTALSGVDHHLPRVSLLALENTHMAAGGAVWPTSAVEEIRALARGVPMHLDGARLWHAEVATGTSMAELARPVDTVMCCLSKGLGAPVGSLLAGRADFIEAAILERHRLGGAMRQSGVIAAAGLVAMNTMTERLVVDHERAHRLAEAVADRWPGNGFDPSRVQTNIVIFSHPDPAALLAYLRSAGVLAGTVAPGRVRFVTHYDVDDEGIDLVRKALVSAPG